MPKNLTLERERMLLWVLRTDFGLTGAKYGCGIGICGACTVLVDNETVRSCQFPAEKADGKTILTIEGLEKNGMLHPLQKTFSEHDALQCGYCTPGMILTAYALLIKNPTPGAEAVKESMEYNLCRCGAHNRIVTAVLDAADRMKGGSP